MSDPKLRAAPAGYHHVAVRLDDPTLARLDRMREKMSGPAAKFGILLSQSDALRASIVAGLTLLEKEYGVEPGPSLPTPLPDTRHADPASRKRRKPRVR